MWFGAKKSEKADDGQAELMALLGRHAGVGLWDARLFNGDPMHERSEWRWSEEFRSLLGYDPDDRQGFPDKVNAWSDKLHPEDQQRTFEAFMACLNDVSGKTGYDVTYRLKTAKGDYRWYRAVGGVARDDRTGRAERACGALIDVHEEKNRSEVSEILSRSAGVGLWDALIHDGDPMHPKSLWTWSEEFRRLLGFEHFDLAGFPNVVQSWSDRLHPEDAERTFTAFMACLNDHTGRTGYDVEYRLKMKNGEYQWFRAIGDVIRDREGRPVRACGSLIDIHDGKMAAEARLHAEEEKQAKIRELAGSLEDNVVTTISRTSDSANAVSAASKQLASSIGEISQHVEQASRVTSNASREGEKTSDLVNSLMNAADKIGEIVNLIQSIAAQTNMLALNATIEAARAGDAGRGFAVVATEVKNLASQTARATEEISSQIQAVQAESSHVSDAIARILDTTRQVQEISGTIASAMTEQDSATREIARSIGLVVDEISDISGAVSSTVMDLRA